MLIDKSPPAGNAPEELDDSRKLRVGSNGGALLDSVDELMELVERHSDDDVDEEEKIVLVECDNAGVAGINPEDPECEIEEEYKCPEG